MSVKKEGIQLMNQAAVNSNPLGTRPIGRLVMQFAVPSIISLVINALYNIVDQIFVGWGVGYLGNAATNVIFPMTVFMLALSALFGDGCAAYFSLQLGQGNKEKASAGVCSSMIFTVTVGFIFMCIVLLFLEPICILFGATENSLPYAMDYGFYIALGFVFSSIDVALSTIVRADGSPKYSMVGLLLGCVTNIILDPIFIFVFHWGVKGAALATIAGQFLNAVFLLAYIPRFKNVSVRKEYFIPRLSVVKNVVSLGASSFILQFSIVLLVTVSNKLLVKYGALSKYGADIPIATMGITMKVNQIVINIVQGIATGAQPIIGYNYGAGKYDRTKRTFKIIVVSSTAAMLAAFIIFQLFPMQIVSLFGSEDALYNEFAVKCLKIYLMLCFLNGVQMCTGFFFQAVGRPAISSINTLAKQIGIILPAMIILCAVIGVDGALWAGPVADGLSFVLSVILLKVNWKKVFPGEK